MSKKKKKYTWRIDEDPPSLDEHSHTKHLIISDYLKRYVEVYMSNATIERLKLTIVDGFAGGGKYKAFDSLDITDGSPFLILKSIKEAEALINIGRRKPRFVDVDYHFIEKDKPHIDYLRHELSKSEFAHLTDTKIRCYHNEFDTVAPKIIEHIQRKKARTIFILDQYAFKDVPFPAVKDIFSKTNSEVILTFNFDSLQGFLSQQSTNRKALENIGLAQYIDWDRLSAFREAGMWQQAIQEQLANAILKGSGANHMTLFFMKPKKGWRYWLVHLSKVYRARDVMMSLHWKHANTSAGFEHYLGDGGIFSLGFQASKTINQYTLEFGDVFDFGAEAKNRCIEKLSECIPKLLCDNELELPFSQLTENIGSHTPGSGAEIRAALQSSIDNREIIVMSESGINRRKSAQIKNTDIIKYSQHPMRY